MKDSIWNNLVLHKGTKCSSVKLGLGGVTSVRRNHQKYKTRMEQSRVNWDRGQLEWRHPCDILAPNLEELRFNQRDPPASCILPYFVLQSSAVCCNSTITAYVISLNISTKIPADTHYRFHVLSQVVSGTNRLLVSVIAGVPIVILNFAVLFESIIGPLTQVKE